MKNTRVASFALIVFFLLGSSMAFAHHGTANYDTTKMISVRGPVTSFQFINPHVIISMDVKNDKGIVLNWQGALTSPNRLTRTGWTKDSVKPGDMITISGFPAKTGAPEIWIQKSSWPTARNSIRVVGTSSHASRLARRLYAMIRKFREVGSSETDPPSKEEPPH